MDHARLLQPYLVLTLIFVIFAIFYWHFDFMEYHKYQVFTWDSGTYHKLAKHFRDYGISQIPAPNPLGPRVLFPILYGLLAKFSGLSLFNSGYLINMISLLIVCLGTLKIWISREINSGLGIVAISIFLLISSGPFRTTSNYIGQYGFECLIVFIALISIYRLVVGHNFKIFSYIGLLLAGIGREFTVGISLGTIILISLSKISLNRLPNLRVAQYKLSSLAFGVMFGSAGYIFAKWLVPNNHEFEWSIIYTLKDTFRTNLNPVNLIYPFYGGLGIFFFLILANFASKKTTKNFISLIKKEKDAYLIVIFTIIAIFIAYFAGPDRDRYLLWYFPLFGYLALKSLKNLMDLWSRKVFISSFLILIALCWTRFYVPALPHTVFRKDFPVQIKTDYNPNYFSGLPILKNWRLPLKEFQVKPDGYISMDKPPTTQTAYFASNQTLDEKGLEHVPVIYRAHSNYIPFPLGIPTNQYELLATHPYWGNFRVRLALLLQWLFLQSIFGFLILKRTRKIDY